MAFKFLWELILLFDNFLLLLGVDFCFGDYLFWICFFEVVFDLGIFLGVDLCFGIIYFLRLFLL